MTENLSLDIYLRLSDLRLEDLNEDGESKGLVHAEKTLRDIALRMGATINEVIIENDFVDGKPKPASAFKRKTVLMPDGKKRKMVVRPGFRRLLERIEQKQSGGFITVDLDRAVRDPRDLEDLIDVVSEAKANVRSQTGTLTFTNGGTANEIILARLMVTIASKSSTDTARRVAEARKRQAENGEWHGGKRPYGFTDDGITVIPSEAEEIIKATRAILGGQSLRSCVQDLRKRNVPTVKGGPWTPGSLKDILCRPRNAGIMVYRGQELPNRAPWEPIVSVDELRAVTNRLTLWKAEPGRAPRWLGTGIYYCSCGGKVSAHSQKTRSPRYRCKDTGLMGGDHTSRNIEELDKFVIGLIVDWCAQPIALHRIAPANEEKIDVAGLRAQVNALTERLAEKTAANFDGRMTDAQYELFTKLTSQKIFELESQLKTVRVVRPVENIVEAAQGPGDLRERRLRVQHFWDEATLGVQRSILQELLTIKLLPARRGKIFDPSSIEVIWNL